jgi:hypothetical protein
MPQEYPVNRDKAEARKPIHPGVIFAKDVMPELRRHRTIGEIATLLGISRQTSHRVMAGEMAISPDMAPRGQTLWQWSGNLDQTAGALRYLGSNASATERAAEDSDACVERMGLGGSLSNLRRLVAEVSSSHASAAPSPTRGVAAGLLSRKITGEVFGDGTQPNQTSMCSQWPVWKRQTFTVERTT